MKDLVKTSLAAVIAVSSVSVAVPAQARHYQQGYNYDNYDRGNYDARDYRGEDRRYSNYDNRNYRSDRNYYRGQRCSRGTGGTIIGAVVGGLLGREVVGRRGDRTAGAIVGAGAGALAGRAIARSGSSRC